MHQYVETNPYFVPGQRSDIQIPQQIEPEPRQPWEHAPIPHYQDQVSQAPRIHPRTRLPRARPTTPPTPPPRQPFQPRPDPYLPLVPSTQPQSHHPLPHSGPSSSSHPQPLAHSRPKPTSHHQSRPQQPDYGLPLPPRDNLMYPTVNKTKPLTWLGAVFCCILWLVIILGGLLVLIIYLVYRPRTPHFEISNASLNAAYLDMGTLLNADMTVLANFSNPNRKVDVDFSYVTLRLYFAHHPIAIQYIEPFSVLNTEKKLHFVELVSSQVRLPSEVTRQLAIQMQKNRIVFEIDGIFHTRSNFGSLLRYSYWLYAHCTIVMTAPPTGVMIERKCRTKD